MQRLAESFHFIGIPHGEIRLFVRIFGEVVEFRFAVFVVLAASEDAVVGAKECWARMMEEEFPISLDHVASLDVARAILDIGDVVIAVVAVDGIALL